MWDKDPTDDPLLARWDNAIRTWDIDFLRDNPLAKLYTSFETATTKIVDTAGEVADNSLDAAKALAKVIAWAPYVLAGDVSQPRSSIRPRVRVHRGRDHLASRPRSHGASPET
jgi:hypothetical protein